MERFDRFPVLMKENNRLFSENNESCGGVGERREKKQLLFIIF